MVGAGGAGPGEDRGRDEHDQRRYLQRPGAPGPGLHRLDLRRACAACPAEGPGRGLMTGEGGETSSTIGGGTFSGPVLQARDVVNPTFVTNQAAAAPVALAQLPPLAAGFTGRDVELAQAAGLLGPA